MRVLFVSGNRAGRNVVLCWDVLFCSCGLLAEVVVVVDWSGLRR